MREILFRGKRVDNHEWVEGYYCNCIRNINGEKTYPAIQQTDDNSLYFREVIPETVGQYTGVTDKNGRKIFEGDIIRYNTDDGFDCQSLVQFGEYEQDGSSGEYNAREVVGWYVDVDNFTCPDWAENQPELFPNYLFQQNLKEVAACCEVIGNIHDNPELLTGGTK